MTQQTATAEKKEENKVGYVGRRINSKQAKLYLAFTPKHGAISRETMKFYMGLREKAPGPATQPNSKKKDKN